MLFVCVVAAFVWLPDTFLRSNLQQIAASALYVVNWALAIDSVDYLGADSPTSLVQHYWSLSVEEQFYLIWPLLLVAAIAIVRLRVRRSTPPTAWPQVRTTVSIVLLAVFLGSLAYSIYLTGYAKPLAYFSTFTRAWEFAAGALLAILSLHISSPRRDANSTARRALFGEVAAWAGVALIAWSAISFSDASPFPGAIALLPVAGALLIIGGAGSVSTRSFTRKIYSVGPVQRIGDWSYAIYLWHWPLIVLYPFVFGEAFGLLGALAIGLISVALGCVTKVLVEDPVRTARWWAVRRWPSYLLALIGAIVVVAIAFAGTRMIDARTFDARQWVQTQLADESPCFGASALAPQAQCGDPFAVTDRINTRFAATDLDPNWCVAEPGEEWRSCEYGATSGFDQTIALVGDSHAAALVPAFDSYFAERGWRVVTYLRVGCPGVTDVPFAVPGREEWKREECATWSKRVLDEIESREDIGVVAFSSFSSSYDHAVTGEVSLSAAMISETWERLRASDKEVLFIRDVPSTSQVNIPRCLDMTHDVKAPCALDRSTAVSSDEFTAATAASNLPLVDMTDFFCDSTDCFAVIGDVIVYADSNHVSGTYARTLASFLGDRIMTNIGEE
ncbi:hypothetical protein ASD43_02385 [Microbacterium sp. Root553]|nr:hypothetical protein ASD43_02385 [Microbacterium sp. Root553]